LTTANHPRTEAIVLKRIPFGDSSLVVHLFCEDRGRAAILVKGAFRAKGAAFGAFDLLERVEVSLPPRRPGVLGSPASVHTLDNRRRLRGRLDALAAALYTAELLDFALTEAPQARLYREFDAWIARLDAPESPAPGEVALGTLAFELAFLRELGLQPALDACASCGAGLTAGPDGLPYSVGAGGVVCEACARREPALRRFPPASLSLAIALRNGETPAAPPAPGNVRDVRRFLDDFHRYYLDTLPRSRPALERVFRAPADASASCS
jgi:DNA repair protein RecO (recombination protein O)